VRFKNPFKPRWPGFFVYANDLMAATQHMTPEERGGFWTLALQAWQEQQPGVLPADDALLARFSGLGDRWAACRDGIGRAFVRSGRFWILGWMATEGRRQRRVTEGRSKGARATNAKRSRSTSVRPPFEAPKSDLVTHGKSTSKVAERALSDTLKGRSPVLGTWFLGEDLPPHPTQPVNGAVSVSTEARQVLDALTMGRDEWEEAFANLLWPEYPRKVARLAALRAWRGVRPYGQETFNRVFLGLVKWREYWRSQSTPSNMIPHAATWLNQQRWLEEPG
jgi:uncharacterized protein YdaU (DUF1376 family)